MNISPDDVVQLDPALKAPLGGCFMVVTRVSEDRVSGYVSVPLNMKSMPAMSFCNIGKAQVQRIGKAAWLREDVKLPPTEPRVFGEKHG